VTNKVRLEVDNAEVTTGTATIYYHVCDNGTDKWLDTDESTLTVTRTGLSVTYDADVGWKHDLTVPSSLTDLVVDYEIDHSVYDFIGSGSARVDTESTGGSGLEIQLGG